MSSLGTWTREQFDPKLDWNDVEWIKKRWGGKLILKGVMDVEDARLAADSGADALIVSNHGGRQLDGAPSSIAALPAIADEVGNRIEVWMDGGIRSGQDVLKAWALGARGTMIGRAFLYGLGAMGEAGRREVPADHPQGTRHHDGLLRPHRHPQRRPPHPAAEERRAADRRGQLSKRPDPLHRRGAEDAEEFEVSISATWPGRPLRTESALSR